MQNKAKPSGEGPCAPWDLRDEWGQGHGMRNSHPGRMVRDTDTAQPRLGQRYHQIYIIYVQLLHPSWAEGRPPQPLRPLNLPNPPEGLGRASLVSHTAPTLPPAPLLAWGGTRNVVPLKASHGVGRDPPPNRKPPGHPQLWDEPGRRHRGRMWSQQGPSSSILFPSPSQQCRPPKPRCPAL